MLLKNTAACREQQALLDRIATDLGVIAYRPNYHGKRGDKNTVLFYTAEDHAYNQKMDRESVLPPHNEQYRQYFWSFENSDRNGFPSTAFENHGAVDLRSAFFRKVLEGHIRLALANKKQTDHLLHTGGIWAPREADDVYNDLNREMIEAFRLIHGDAFLGRINFYDTARERICDGETIYEKCEGQKVCNFGCDFIVPRQDDKIQEYVRTWNRGDWTPYDETIEKITDRVEELGGLLFVWY